MSDRTPSETTAEIHTLLADLLGDDNLDWVLAVRRPQTQERMSVSWAVLNGDHAVLRTLVAELVQDLDVGNQPHS